MSKKVVSGGKYLDQMQEYAETHKIDVFSKLILAILLILLAVGYMSLKNSMEMKVDIPTSIRESGEMRVGYSTANDLYYMVWGQFFVDQYTSLDPINVTKKLNDILAFLEPSKSKIYAQEFSKKADYIKKNKIKQTYIREKESMLEGVSQDGMRVFHSKGVLVESIGGVDIRKSCEYKLGIRIENYRIFYGAIEEKCTNLPGV